MTLMKTTQRTALTAMALAFGLGTVGCSVFEPAQQGHLIQPEPAVSPYAVASADGAFVAPPVSLIAADSIGLSTFGQSVVMDDLRADDGQFAEVQP